MTRIAAMPGTRPQRGSTLIVALIMLALLTLIAVSAMKSTTSSIQVVGNAQFREEAKAVAQKAMENVLSNKNFSSAVPPSQSMDVNGDGTMDYIVTFAEPKCRSRREIAEDDPEFPPSCVSSTGTATLCYWAVWNIRANVTDNHTGATVTLHQGVRTVSGSGDALSKGC